MTQPQISPDGRWTWDGTQWVPRTDVPSNQPSELGYGTPPPYGTAYPSAYPPAPSQNDGKAVASLVLGVVGLCGIGSLLAVILGHQSRGAAKRAGRQPSGMALAGVILGYVGLVSMVLVLVVFALGSFVSGSFEDTTNTVCTSQYADGCP